MLRRTPGGLEIRGNLVSAHDLDIPHRRKHHTPTLITSGNMTTRSGQVQRPKPLDCGG